MTLSPWRKYRVLDFWVMVLFNTIGVGLTLFRIGKRFKAVHQESVLGPFLFVLYINDLSEVVGNNKRLNADDPKILAIVDTVIERKGFRKIWTPYQYGCENKI